MCNVVASLYQTDRGVKILAVGNCKSYFLINGVPLRSTIDEKITFVAELSGEMPSMLVTLKPDVVVIKDSISESKVVTVKFSEGIDNEIVESITLNEYGGHVFFVVNPKGGECTYSQYLFIDQLRSLKAKLNID